MYAEQYISDIILKKPIQNDSYLGRIPAIRYLMEHKSLAFSENVTFFVGENGTGKSTLIEAIAVAYGFNPEGGTKNFSFSTNKTHSDLWNHLTIAKRKFPKDGFFLRAESFYNVATNIDEMDAEPGIGEHVINSYGGISLHNQSHGESFLTLVENRFRGDSIYILDEPEAALSPMRLLRLIAEINALAKKNSQFIIATHSPILMAFPNAMIYQFSEDGIESVTYKNTEHYQVTKYFLDNPERMLQDLLE